MRFASPLYPFASRWHDAGGHRMHYLDEGAGEPVLLLHGNPSWSFLWRELAADLRRDRRVLVPDHVGCGLSDKPGDETYAYTLESRVRDVEGLLDRLGVREGLTLVAHDWGGMIGTALAVRRPGLVRRFVLMNTAGFLLPPGKKAPWMLAWARRSRLAAGLIRGFNAFARIAAATCAVKRPLRGERLRGFLAPYGTWRDRIATLRFVQDIPLAPGDPAYDLVRRTQEGLAALRGRPMLLAWGLRDYVFDAAYLAEWRRRFPEAEVLEYPEAGHYVLEDEAEALVPAVRSFLARNPIEAVRP